MENMYCKIIAFSLFHIAYISQFFILLAKLFFFYHNTSFSFAILYFCLQNLFSSCKTSFSFVILYFCLQKACFLNTLIFVCNTINILQIYTPLSWLHSMIPSIYNLPHEQYGSAPPPPPPHRWQLAPPPPPPHPPVKKSHLRPWLLVMSFWADQNQHQTMIKCHSYLDRHNSQWYDV